MVLLRAWLPPRTGMFRLALASLFVVMVAAVGFVGGRLVTAQGTPETGFGEEAVSPELCAKYLEYVESGQGEPIELSPYQVDSCLTDSLLPADGQTEVRVDPVTGIICGANRLGDAIGTVCTHVDAPEATYHQLGGIPTGPAAILLIDPARKIAFVRVTDSSGEKDFGDPQDEGLWLAAVVDETPAKVELFNKDGEPYAEFAPADEAARIQEGVESDTTTEPHEDEG